MIRESEYVIGSGQSPQNESIYTQDVVGELCDAWRRNGDGFAVDATGNYEKITSSPAGPAREDFSIEHNPALVSEVFDSRGRPVKCVTTAGYTGYTRALPRVFERLMAELPLDQLVYTAASAQSPKPRHPSAVEPFGIRLNAVPQVKEIVDSAYTRLPRGAHRYPPGSLVLDSYVKWKLLDYFETVLTPPAVEMSEPVSPLPASAAVTPVVLPPRQLSQSPRPGESAPRRMSPAACYGRLGFIAASYGFTLAAGAAGLSAIEARSDGSELGPKALLALLFSLGSIVSYVGSKEMER